MYLYSKIYTGVARTFWLVLDVLRGSSSAPGSVPGHDVTGPSPDMIDWMPMLAQQETDLKSSSWLWNTPCQWSPGWDWLSPQQQLRDSESARLGSGAARQQCTGLDHDLCGCSCQLELIVEPLASTGGRHVGQERKPWSTRASWAEAKLGQNLKHKFEILQGWS